MQLLLKKHIEENKSVSFYLRHGHVLPCVIKEINEDHLVGFNQQYNKVIIMYKDVLSIAYN
ncbi:MAG TPA: hypothetical protein ENK21_05320 [Trueperaceae bacterium]|nr:hypothetical protein [Trueperaceae bacterium]